LGVEDSPRLIAAASAEARNTFGVCEDLAAVLFPKGRRLPTEEMQAAVGATLHDLVLSLENALRGERGQRSYSMTWAQLSKSNALSSPKLMRFALARVAERRIESRLLDGNPIAKLAYLPSKLLGHKNEHVARLARELLAVEHSNSVPSRSLYTQLDAVTLSKLAWLISEAIIEHNITAETGSEISVPAFLAKQVATNAVSVSAQKLLFAIGSEYQIVLHDPSLAGPHLFVAEMSREFQLSYDTILHMIDSESAAPLALLLSLRGMDELESFSVLSMLRGVGRDDSEIANLYENFEYLDHDTAHQALKIWRESEGYSDVT
jgi:hypothetical protein